MSRHMCIHKIQSGMHLIGDLAERLGSGSRKPYPAWYVKDTSAKGKPEKVEVVHVRGPLDRPYGKDYAQLSDGRVVVALYLFPRKPGFVKPRFIALRDDWGVSHNWVGLPRKYKPRCED